MALAEKSAPASDVSLDLAADHRARKRNIVRAVLWMAGTLLSFSVTAVSIRQLTNVGMNIFEIFAVRSIGSLLILGALLVIRADLRAYVLPRHMRLHLVRNTIHYASQFMWAQALIVLPLATVFALEFTMPAWAALLAVWLLGERMTPSRIGVVVLGLIGVLVILRPGLESVKPAAILVLIAAIGFALTVILTKKLTLTETTFGIVFWMAAIQLPLSLAGSRLDVLSRFSVHDIAPLLGVAIAGLTSHYCLTNAFRAGDATVVVPLDFMRIPLIAVVGWALYGERLDIFVLFGALIIVAGVIWNLRAESARAH